MCPVSTHTTSVSVSGRCLCKELQLNGEVMDATELTTGCAKNQTSFKAQVSLFDLQVARQTDESIRWIRR